MKTAEKEAVNFETPSKVFAVKVAVDHGEGHSSNAQSYCSRCGGKHSAAVCYFKDAECHYCKKRGHITRVCRRRPQQQRQQQQQQPRRGHGQRKSHSAHVLAVDEEGSQTPQEYSVCCNMTDGCSDAWRVVVRANGVDLPMEIDTGASVSVINEETYRTSWSAKQCPPLQPTNARLRSYTGEQIGVLGTIVLSVSYRGQEKTLSLLVVNGKGLTLLGRDWLAQLRLDWKEIHSISFTFSQRLQAVLK